MKRGYQSTAYGTYSTAIKVKGAIKPANVNPNDPTASTFYDVLDLVVPIKEKDGVFLTTNYIHYTNQTLDKCVDDEAICKLESDCPQGEISSSGYGFNTGRCLYNNELTRKNCEVEAWCPLMLSSTQKIRQVFFTLEELKKITIFIKSYVFFESFNIKLFNIPSNQNSSFLRNCRYNSMDSATKNCPIFYADDIVKATNSFDGNLFQKGGVIAIYVEWVCNFDWGQPEDCKPKYRFEKINPDSSSSPGFNFWMVENYYTNGTKKYRDTTKLYGIQFIIITTVMASKFNVAQDWGYSEYLQYYVIG